MKFRYLIYIIILGLAMCSCRSHRTVVHGDDGTVLVKGGGKDVPASKVGKPDGYVGATKSLLDEAYSWLGTPYKYGGENKSGADCSGFVMMVYLKALDIKLPRVSREQGEYCERIDKKDLYPGDLVFFDGGQKGKVSHVGIYVGEGLMIHASSSKGVIVSDLSQKYYTDHYHHSGRVTLYYKLIKR